jgi:hypothetical protein
LLERCLTLRIRIAHCVLRLPAHRILFRLRRDGCTAFTEGLQSLAPGSPSSPQSPLLGRGFWIWGGANTRVFFCASSVSRRGYPFILVTEVTEVTGEENATQRRHSTATIRSIDPELRYLQRGGQHPPVERNIDLTLIALITLFTRPVGSHLCTRPSERLALSLSIHLRSGGNALYLCLLLYIEGLGPDPATAPYLTISALRLRNKRNKRKK